MTELGLLLHFRFALAGDTLRLTLPEVRETGIFRLETLYIPEHRLISGLAAQGDQFYRYGHRRITWSRHWCPGNGEVQPWEDIGAVADAVAERGHRETKHACVWNATTCAAIRTSIYIWYADDTYVSTGKEPQHLRARYEGIEIARGTDRFLPWREDTIYVYSAEGGAQRWMLPEHWDGRIISAFEVAEAGERPAPAPRQEGRQITLHLPPGVPLVLRQR